MGAKNKSYKLNIKQIRTSLRFIDFHASDDEMYKTVILGLNKLSEAVSHNRYAPVPYDLSGSVFDPQIIALRSNAEFRTIYEDNFKDTAEEIVTSMLISMMLFDRNITYQNISGDTLVYYYAKRSAAGNIISIATALSNHILTRKGDTDNVYKMLKTAYPCILKIIDEMKFDINTFVDWYIRYYC